MYNYHRTNVGPQTIQWIKNMNGSDNQKHIDFRNKYQLEIKDVRQDTREPIDTAFM
jgi:hypothetical protein